MTSQPHFRFLSTCYIYEKWHRGTRSLTSVENMQQSNTLSFSHYHHLSTIKSSAKWLIKTLDLDEHVKSFWTWWLYPIALKLEAQQDLIFWASTENQYLGSKIFQDQWIGLYTQFFWHQFFLALFSPCCFCVYALGRFGRKKYHKHGWRRPKFFLKSIQWRHPYECWNTTFPPVPPPPPSPTSVIRSDVNGWVICRKTKVKLVSKCSLLWTYESNIRVKA